MHDLAKNPSVVSSRLDLHGLLFRFRDGGAHSLDLLRCVL
jgi:hypothetical protein